MSQEHGPLSPHLQVYRWQLTSILSILHRASGLALAPACGLFVLWLAAAALGDDAYAAVTAVYGSWPGRAVLVGCTFAAAYHAFNGLRHLVWDAGYGFSLPAVRGSGWAVVLGSVAVTALAWIAAAAGHG